MPQLRRALQREPRAVRDDLVWQPRFAYGTAGVILGGLVLLTLPLWVVLLRMTDPAANNGAGPNVGSLVALSMMLMGVFLTGAATWTILVEMRARVRMVDALAGIGDRELPHYQPAFDPTPFDPAQWGPAPDEMNQPVTAPIPAGRGAHQLARPQVSPIERSARLVAPLHGAGSFGQLHAQIAMLAVALALFVSATVLSLN